MEWVLILFVHASLLASGDSVALTQVPMENEKACRLAGDAARSLVYEYAKIVPIVYTEIVIP